MKYNYRVYDNEIEDVILEGEADTPEGCVAEAVRLLNGKSKNPDPINRPEEKFSKEDIGKLMELMEKLKKHYGMVDTILPLKQKECSMGFDEAIKALKKGSKVSRTSWDDVVVFLHDCLSIDDDKNILAPLLVTKHAGESTLFPYLPSTLDLLANDWMVEVS